jgi:hypothetical protein
MSTKRKRPKKLPRTKSLKTKSLVRKSDVENPVTDDQRTFSYPHVGTRYKEKLTAFRRAIESVLCICSSLTKEQKLCFLSFLSIVILIGFLARIDAPWYSFAAIVAVADRYSRRWLSPPKEFNST